MEIYENIVNILIEKKISKREFAQKLIALEPKSNRTGETISENIVYSYLSGQTAIKAYIVPYIAEVLQVPEQFLYEETPRTRLQMIKYLMRNLSKEEEEYIKTTLAKNSTIQTNDELIELLAYAPEPMKEKLKKKLQDIKNISQQI